MKHDLHTLVHKVAVHTASTHPLETFLCVVAWDVAHEVHMLSAAWLMRIGACAAGTVVLLWLLRWVVYLGGRHE